MYVIISTMECVREKQKSRSRKSARDSECEDHETVFGSSPSERCDSVNRDDRSIQNMSDTPATVDTRPRDDCNNEEGRHMGTDRELSDSDRRDDGNNEERRRMGTDRGLSDSDRRKLDSLKLLLSEQAETLTNRREEVEGEKHAAEERVTDHFRKLHEILASKEHDLMVKINSRFNVSIDLLSDFGSCVDVENQKISDLLTSCRESKDHDIEQLKNEIDVNAQLRNSVLCQNNMPHLVLKERAMQTLKDLDFADLQSAPSSTEQTLSETVPGGNEVSEAEGNSEAHVSANLETERLSENQEQDATEESLENGAVGISRQTDTIDLSRQANSTGAITQAPTPSAPPLNPTDDPPPYWQAIGLTGPEEDEHNNQSIKLPENKLQLWNFFNSLKKHGLRMPVPVALTWNGGRIGIVDKANRRVEFFAPNGRLISEMTFERSELRDITFLDDSYSVGNRYVVNSSKERTLYIIGIEAYETIRIFRKLHFVQQYSCICRGPRVQTLVGAEVSMTTGFPCVVNMFTLAGQILLSITHTPGYALWQYIRSVDVFGSTIIILDWKINLAAMFHDDGSAIGEYHGTENSPFINPSDMTLDHHGNVFILNGEFQNIHVLDLQCHPLEIISIPKVSAPATGRLSLIAFDVESQRLCVAKSNGDTAIFTFENGYESLPQGRYPRRLLLPHQNTTRRERRNPEVLPLVEGMLPSTLETIMHKQAERKSNYT